MRPTTLPLRRRRLASLVVLAAAALGLVVGPLALPAYAEGTASSFVAEGNLGFDGVLKVKETITFTGSAPAELSQKFETEEDLVGDRKYVQTLSDITASLPSGAVDPQVQTGGRFTTVTVASGGATEVVITYTVRGAVVRAPNGDTATALRWRMLQGFSAQVTSFTATVQVPSQFTYLKCTAGSPNSTVPCQTASGGNEANQTPTFTDGPRGEGEVVAVDIGFPAVGGIPSNEKVDYRWTVGRAFSVGPLPLALTLGLLVLGGLGLFWLHRRSGVDAVAENGVSPVGTFVPTGPGRSEFRVVGDVRPGHVGTVADERVDPIDVTATLLDLAVRGHLLITELPREAAFARTDWELTRLSADGDLRPFEQALLDGIADPDGSVRVSELSSRVNDSIAVVQDALYDDVVAHGWFERRPDAIRNRWTHLALVSLIVAVALTAVLAAFTIFGLVGLALVALALGLMYVGQSMPARTAKGAALLAGLATLRSDLASHPTTQMEPGTELTEMSELLPYTVVLGGTDRWLDAIAVGDVDAEADSEDLPWYHGPPAWQLGDLPDSLRNFVTTVTGSLFSRS